VDYNCRVYYADLWGKKKEKLAALDDASMDSIEWKELKLTEPYYFFVPKDFALEDEYEKGFRINEMIGMFSLGIQSGRDELFYDASNSMLLQRMKNLFLKPLSNEMRNRFNIIDRSGFMLETHIHDAVFSEDKVSKASYRPFDTQYIYYDAKVLKRAFNKVMSHLMKPNLSLCIVKNSRNGQIGNYLVSDSLVGKDYVSPLDNCHVFPLYLYEENMGKVEKRANLDKDIVEKIAAILGLKNNSLRSSASLRLCVKNTTPSPREELSPEDIFDYIYGVLHSPSYRTKFKEFLKVDFPRIPYPKDLGEFERFCAAGRELRTVHLMKDAEPSLFETHGRFPVVGDNVVDTVRFEIIGDNFNTETQRLKDTEIKPHSEPQCLSASVLKKSGRVYINSTQYFDNVPLEAWEQAIGGYRPAEKYLKDRKNRALSQEERRHYQRIILALTKTREIMDSLG
jgi:predicted helicase